MLGHFIVVDMLAVHMRCMYPAALMVCNKRERVLEASNVQLLRNKFSDVKIQHGPYSATFVLACISQAGPVNTMPA